ncbi:2-polyprenyl-6-methoxyphenol hydroxylase-like FAD-dependent oxidoreductase [Nocardia tenerifensis]|uniref:2-polyprenyl-6-methoxyphenol hydroxylase-like FAD-dependent oxidoreductase n=1 Tax=Nocardia tenerifensis TaxID=228006 RepID=A0A318JZ20_9NOCA|nr:FAD-dependent monooxygenase [Nocardia tenerifensis]PXX60232.1 2-polyprenyl-6-methoxyphenol hydroxylase-like FAD-dependent oxidoreductase [Nocardia tenerifensis]
MSKAVIVGGGIGGLATAIAFQRRGWTVEVLERAPELTEIGAGLSIWPNALRALDALGVGDAVRARAVEEASSGIRERRGRWLSRPDTAAARERYGDPIMLHRADLLDILRREVPESALRTGISVTEVRPAGTVVHSAGESTGDLVVGADGIHSVVRRALLGQIAPRYSGYTAWRMVVAPTEPFVGIGESWGRGERFGYGTLADGRVYCYATANAPAGTETDGLPELRRRFSDWHDPIPALLAAADESAVLHNDIYELPNLKTYVGERIALIGDAAHAMTPNLGQGACQALEDAVVLARVATTEPDLTAYDRERRPRTQMIAAMSRRIGTVAQWASAPLVAIRNAGLRMTPDSAQFKALAPVLDWSC